MIISLEITQREGEPNIVFGLVESNVKDILIQEIWKDFLVENHWLTETTEDFAKFFRKHPKTQDFHQIRSVEYCHITD